MKDTWDVEDPLLALQKGVEGPFEAFVLSATPTFLAFFGRLGAGRTEAEDLVQELFLKLFRNSGSYEPKGRFSAYAFRVARNAWIDRGRRRASRIAEAPGGSGESGAWGSDGESKRDRAVVVDEAPEPIVNLAQREEVAALRGALALLPEHHRLVFELGVLQEQPYSEIADALGIPVGTVKSRMFNAVRKLREALGGEA